MTAARRILADVSLIHGLRVSTLLGPARHRAACRARWEAMWRLRNELNMSLPEIGRELDRDHSTVVSGLRRFEELLDTEEGLAERLALPVAA